MPSESTLAMSPAELESAVMAGPCNTANINE